MVPHLFVSVCMCVCVRVFLPGKIAPWFMWFYNVDYRCCLLVVTLNVSSSVEKGKKWWYISRIVYTKFISYVLCGNGCIRARNFTGAFKSAQGIWCNCNSSWNLLFIPHNANFMYTGCISKNLTLYKTACRTMLTFGKWSSLLILQWQVSLDQNKVKNRTF